MEGIDKKRLINERKFPYLENLAGGGRKYWCEISGKFGYSARYVKEVDRIERTVKFYQEIYDNHSNLVEIHQKFPVDLGHRKVRRER